MFARRILTVSAVAVALTVLPGSAEACVDPAELQPYLRRELPQIPNDAVAAEVEIVSTSDTLPHIIIEARIIRMLSGTHAGARMRIQPRTVSSCSGIPTVGARGIVVGRVLSSSDDLLVIDPVPGPTWREERDLRARRRATLPESKSE